jgi:hypothetical protein
VQNVRGDSSAAGHEPRQPDGSLQFSVGLRGHAAGAAEDVRPCEAVLLTQKPGKQYTNREASTVATAMRMAFFTVEALFSFREPQQCTRSPAHGEGSSLPHASADDRSLDFERIWTPALPVSEPLICFIKPLIEKSAHTSSTLKQDSIHCSSMVRHLIRGKAIGIAIALALLLIPATLIGVAALTFTTDLGDLNDDVSRFWLLALVYGIYFAILLLSRSVSRRVRSHHARGAGDPRSPTASSARSRANTRRRAMRVAMLLLNRTDASSTHSYRTGSTISVSIVDVISPPITTVASGRCTSDPGLVDLGIPEHQVQFDGGGHASQTDLWALLRAPIGLVSMAVEAKNSAEAYATFCKVMGCGTQATGLLEAPDAHGVGTPRGSADRASHLPVVCRWTRDRPNRRAPESREATRPDAPGPFLAKVTQRKLMVLKGILVL